MYRSCCTWSDPSAAKPWSAPLTSSPRHCAPHLLAPRTLFANLLTAQDGAEGRDGSVATLGIAAKSTEPVAVAVWARMFFSAAPTTDRTWRVLASGWEGRRPGLRRKRLRCQRQQRWHRWQRPCEGRTVALRQSCCSPPIVSDLSVEAGTSCRALGLSWPYLLTDGPKRSKVAGRQPVESLG